MPGRVDGFSAALLGEAGLRVPDDVSVVGYDDKDPSAYFRPALSTVRQPMRAMGEDAVRLLLIRIEDGDGGASGQTVLLAPELVVRESCGARRRLEFASVCYW